METINRLVNDTASSIRVYLVQKLSNDYFCYIFPNELHTAIKSAYVNNFNSFTKDRAIQ